MAIFILVVWCLSMFLYAIGLTAHESSRGKLFSLMLALCLHDVWYFIVRLVVLISYTLVSYRFIFFFFKNILVICLVLFKLYALLREGGGGQGGHVTPPPDFFD